MLVSAWQTFVERYEGLILGIILLLNIVSLVWQLVREILTTSRLEKEHAERSHYETNRYRDGYRVQNQEQEEGQKKVKVTRDAG